MSKFFSQNFKDAVNPLLLGLVCGFYPLVFYCANNFWAVNSWAHFGFFLLFFIGIPVSIFTLEEVAFRNFSKLGRIKPHILFVTIVMTVAVLMSWAMYLDIKKKVLLLLLVICVAASIKLSQHYKKLLVLILLMSILPTITCAIKLTEQFLPQKWNVLNDDLADIKFKHRPNIYMIQPDGYVGKTLMENPLYAFNNPLYSWLSKNGFKLYDDFRSNYPASLTSNASMFAMKQHHFGRALFPSIEMPHAREFLAGDNNAIKILRNNGYSNFFIVQDDYFQQNLPRQQYDYYNIDADKIPLFSDGKNLEADVFFDLKAAMDTVSGENPRFYFVERLLPHHIHFSASKIEERDMYGEKIKKVNVELKEIIDYISEKDATAIIIILADHGGWVGLGSYDEMFSTRDTDQIKSVFSTMAAVKWNGYLEGGYDKDLKSNVNVFRVLFSVLSGNSKYLNHLEDDSSYILGKGMFSNSVRQAIDDAGNVITK